MAEKSLLDEIQTMRTLLYTCAVGLRKSGLQLDPKFMAAVDRYADGSELAHAIPTEHVNGLTPNGTP